jgi:serpin B
MKKLVIILTILLVLTGCNKTKKEEIKKENLHSNFEFLKLELKDENVIYSPLSLNTAFSMLKEGANGKTKEELDKLFSDIKVNKYETSNELSFANSIFINENHKEEIKKEYVQLLQNKYYSEVLYDTFETPDKINEWIYNKTLGLIEKALNDDQVDQDTMLVLVNALAIDIKWKKEFDENNTYKEIFNSKDESKEYVSMMHNTYSSDALYYKDDNISAVSLDLEPVNNTELEFIAIMPNDIDKYVSELTNETIDELYKND